MRRLLTPGMMREACTTRRALYCGLVVLFCVVQTECKAKASELRVPDEQRLFRDLMDNYESSVRPVLNASKTIVVSFRLSLNQIVDLDERKQVLTTNVFIDQEWEDDNLKWDADDYNGIKTMRVPAALVWLPDTFIFNNADDGATGFMNGVYVVLNANGSVLWPVPVKLKSSCHVDITYFPFDDQKCLLRFGSWIYSGEWMDFISSLESVDLEYYIDNSEWELVAIQFEKNVRTYACCPSPHPDLTYTLNMRRRTFYYIFNIIVPCIMLSVLTLLTFWLPTTSGEKISLGLSVFLAFSMFMLLIAEEVPATSKSVPIIGVYLTTVMTMTSVSVIMSVMVINLYNRGYRAQPAPAWLKVVILSWLCKVLRMKHDIERLAKTIRLEEEEEAKYMCEKHEVAGVFPRRKFGRTPRHTPRPTPQPSPLISPASTPRQLPSPEPLRQNLVKNHVKMDRLTPDRQCHDNYDVLKVDAACHDGSKVVDVAFCDVADADSKQPSKCAHQTTKNNNVKFSDTQNNYLADNDVIDSKSTESLHSKDKYNDVTYSYHIGRLRHSKHLNDTKNTNGATRLFPNKFGSSSIATDMKGSRHNEDVLRSIMERKSKLKLGMGGKTASYSDVFIDDEDEEPVWKKRDTLLKEEREALVRKRRENCQNGVTQTDQSKSKTKSRANKSKSANKASDDVAQAVTNPIINADDGLGGFSADVAGPGNTTETVSCNKHIALVTRREIVVEWQTMAMVIDRLLFWIFLLATVVAYIVILFIIPYSKPVTADDTVPKRILIQS